MLKGHSSDTLEELCRYDSPTIANVIELFDVRPRNSGYMTSAIKAIYPQLKPVIGYASTATYRSAYPAAIKASYLRLADHAESMQDVPKPRFVVFQDLDSPPAAATMGEIMASVYQRFGAAGLITSGSVRDILQIQALNFPLFAADICVSHGYSRIEEIHVPVHVGGLKVSPGDLLHADANGVVLIPYDIAEETAGLCAEYVAAEQIPLDYLAQPDATCQGLRDALTDLNNAGRAIAQRAAGR